MSDIQEGLSISPVTQLTSLTPTAEQIAAAQTVLAAAGQFPTVATTGDVIPPKTVEEHLHEVNQAVVSSGIGDTTAIGGETTLEEVHSRVVALEIKLGQIIRRYFRGEDFSEPST